jgi:hypothetical protein
LLLRRRLLRSFLLLIVLVSAPLFGGSCSFFFVEGPPPPDRRVGLVKCTTGSWAPVTDLVLVAVQALGFFRAATGNEAEYRNDTGISRETGIWLSLGFGTLYTSSAIWGLNGVSACREVKDVEEQQADEDAARARSAAKQARAAAAAAKAAGEAAAAGGSATSKPASQPVPPARAEP